MAVKKKAPSKKPAAKKVATKVVSAAKATASTAKKSEPSFFENFNREDNLHMFVGIVLLVIGLYQLRQWILGLIFIIIGILFVTGYFEKGKKK